MAVPMMEAVPGVGYPNAWLRLRRLGNAIIGYRSSNGCSAWTELTRKTPSPVPTEGPGRMGRGGGGRRRYHEIREPPGSPISISCTPWVVPLVDPTRRRGVDADRKDRAQPTGPARTKVDLRARGECARRGDDGFRSGPLAATPDESQGPGTYPVTLRVTDNGEPPLTAERTFQVTVNEVNAAPEFRRWGPERNRGRALDIGAGRDGRRPAEERAALHAGRRRTACAGPGSQHGCPDLDARRSRWRGSFQVGGGDGQRDAADERLENVCHQSGRTERATRARRHRGEVRQ